jgi:hypothetical protein
MSFLVMLSLERRFMEIREINKKTKRILIEVLEEDYKAIKKRAIDNNMTLKKWIINACALAIAYQDRYKDK